MFKGYLHHMAYNNLFLVYNKRVYEIISTTNWVLKRLLFLRRRAWELAIEGSSRLASFWCSLQIIQQVQGQKGTLGMCYGIGLGGQFFITMTS